jgi:hypothetical protein
MTQTYCGKNCTECTYKETLNCPGCKAGPGRQYGGSCSLAQCAVSKGHESCDTCTIQCHCGMWSNRENIPQWRRQREEADLYLKKSLARRAPELGKWLWLLFWLIIPGSIASLMTYDTMAELSPGVYLAGQILNAIVSAANGVILIKLSSIEDRYGTSGICYLIVCGVNILNTFFGSTLHGALTTLISIAGAIVGLVGQYNEFMAHSTVLSGLDEALAAKWERLWKWHLGALLGTVGGLALALLFPLLGLLVVLAAAITAFVVSVIKLVYLYRTARCFREYPATAVI